MLGGMRDPGIYALTCRPSGEAYVGSSVDPERRRKKHLSLLRANKHFNPGLQRAWDQFTPEDFEWRVLERCPEAELLDRERYWCGAWEGSLFNCRSPGFPSDRKAITAEYLRSILHYCPETGVFTWRERADLPEGRERRRWNTRHAGQRAGTPHRQNHTTYIVIRINGRPYGAHRLAWFYVTGEWPSGRLDHEDGNGSHNWFTNLREATDVQNSGNSRRRSDNTSGYKGVYRSNNGRRWVARIMIDGRKRYLGMHDTPEEAHEAYVEAAKAHYGEFANPG